MCLCHKTLHLQGGPAKKILFLECLFRGVPTPCREHRGTTVPPCCVTLLSLWVSLTPSVVTQGPVGTCSIFHSLQKTQAMEVERDMRAAGAGWALRSLLTQSPQ